MADGCANSDIAGPGVVASFIVTAVLTTACSITAAVLDGMILDETALLPLRLQVWLNRRLGRTTERTIILWRETLDKLMLSLADQQLVTGVALLLSGALFFSVPSDQTVGGTENDNFTMIVSLACLASSSHLASLITLQKYFRAHPISAYVRAVSIVIFSFGLTSCILVDMKSPFSRAFYWLLQGVYNDITEYAPFSDDVLFGGIILYTFYVAVVQLFIGLQARIARCIRILWRKTKNIRPGVAARSKHALPSSLESHPSGEESVATPKPLSSRKRLLKRLFWFLVLGSSFEAFILQIMFATLSLVFIIIMRYTPVFTTCFVDDRDNNGWGFGQTLPMLLLLLPLLSTIEFYFESKKAVGEESEEKEFVRRACCGAYDDALCRVSLPPPVLIRTDSGSTIDSGLTAFHENLHNYQQLSNTARV